MINSAVLSPEFILRSGCATMRLGDTIDDHCSRCKRTTDHDIVAMIGEDVKKVRCRTCNSEHNYRRNRSGRKEMSAAEAFNRVLASVTSAQGQPQSVSKKKK